MKKGQNVKYFLGFRQQMWWVFLGVCFFLMSGEFSVLGSYAYNPANNVLPVPAQPGFSGLMSVG